MKGMTMLLNLANLAIWTILIAMAVGAVIFISAVYKRQKRLMANGKPSDNRTEYGHQLLELEQLAQSIAQVFGLERRIARDHAEWAHPEHKTSLPGRLVDMKITLTSGSGLTVRYVDKNGDTLICSISVQQWAELDEFTREALQLGMIEQYARYCRKRGLRLLNV